MRLTTNSYAVLAVLTELGGGTSYDIEHAAKRLITGFWPLSHTTAYEEPLRLANHGYLDYRQEQEGRHRRFYVVTTSGRHALRSWVSDSVAAPPQIRDEALLKIYAGGDAVALLKATSELRAKLISDLQEFWSNSARQR